MKDKEKRNWTQVGAFEHSAPNSPFVFKQTTYDGRNLTEADMKALIRDGYKFVRASTAAAAMTKAQIISKLLELDVTLVEADLKKKNLDELTALLEQKLAG